jgi:hypothetical protein
MFVLGRWARTSDDHVLREGGASHCFGLRAVERCGRVVRAGLEVFREVEQVVLWVGSKCARHARSLSFAAPKIDDQLNAVGHVLSEKYLRDGFSITRCEMLESSLPEWQIYVVHGLAVSLD